MPITYRKPTEQEVAEALRYIEAEFILTPDAEGQVHLDEVHWTEALAYGPARVGYPACPHHVAQAREVYPQLTDFQWSCLAACADRERVNQCMPTLYTEFRRPPLGVKQ
jgi:hypothetical protein